jgi:hypothetical protein
MSNITKFMIVFKKNGNSSTKVDLCTGWQLDNLMSSKSFRESVDFISPIGSSYTPDEYRISRKLV